MSNPNVIKIHGKDYMTVAGRLELAREAKQLTSVFTEVLQHSPMVVVKATVKISGEVFTGISAANISKSIEKASPYEVAETSAVGRALGFAGFGATDSIASADEMTKAIKVETDEIPDPTDEWEPLVPSNDCPDCGSPLVDSITKSGKSMRKCSTNGWDTEKREATGCKYVKWL